MKHTRIFTATLLSGIGGLMLCVIASRVMADEAPKENRTVAGGENNQEADEEYKPKTKAQLRKQLTPIQYNVTQNAATEPAFRNAYWNNKKEGTYRCRVCDLSLFSSDTKFKSGTGWPSFWDPLNKESIGLSKDWKLFYVRVEVHCKRCGAHLGHVFDDGPKPTGKRYCMNSAAMKFVSQSEEENAKSKKSAKKRAPQSATAQ